MTPPTLLVVIGASAGGVEALKNLVARFDVNASAAILVVLHMSADAESVLADILDRAGPLPARPATDGAAVEGGTILVGPPDRHLMIADGRVALCDTPALDRHRPSIDRLFMSAADSWPGPKVGVVLSGTLDDGVAGLVRLREVGSTIVAQDPDEATFPELPRAAIDRGGAQSMSIAEIAKSINASLA